MCSFYEVENDPSVRDIDCRTTQLFIEGRVVKEIKITEHQYSCRLVVGILRYQATQVIESLLVQSLGMSYQVLQVHFFMI